MSPCSPYDRERPRDSVSTLGSMSALPAWAGDSATLGGTPGHERRAVPPKHAAKCPDCFTSEYLSYLVSSIPTMLWKKQTGCLHALWLEPVPRLLSLIFSDLNNSKKKKFSITFVVTWDKSAAPRCFSDSCAVNWGISLFCQRRLNCDVSGYKDDGKFPLCFSSSHSLKWAVRVSLCL